MVVVVNLVTQSYFQTKINSSTLGLLNKAKLPAEMQSAK